MIVSRSLVAVVVVSTIAIAGGVAHAEQPGHHGVYVHVHIGPGYTNMSASDIDTKIHGSGGAFGLALGGSVSPNVVLYGELFDDIAVGPTIEMNGSTGSASDSTSAGVVGFGGGLRWYFMPSNLFVSTTIAASRLSVQQNNQETGRSDFGVGFSVMAGKEWLVTRHLGLGVALQGFFGSMKEQGQDYRYITTAGALVFSATYN